MAPSAKALKKTAWLLRIIGDKAPHIAHTRSEVADAHCFEVLIATVNPEGV